MLRAAAPNNRMPIGATPDAPTPGRRRRAGGRDQPGEIYRCQRPYHQPECRCQPELVCADSSGAWPMLDAGRSSRAQSETRWLPDLSHRSSSLTSARMVILRPVIFQRRSSRPSRTDFSRAPTKAPADANIDAQRGTIQAIDRVLALALAQGDIAIFSHGGGGNEIAFHVATCRLLTGWHRIEE